MLTEHIRQTEAAPPVVPDDVRQHWKNVFVSYARASQVAGVSTPAGETVDLVKYLLSRNVAQTTPALPADIERGYYQRITELETSGSRGRLRRLQCVATGFLGFRQGTRVLVSS